MNMDVVADQVETPSGKGASDENFPVGSFLLPRRLRPHVATYYRFARAIDDIADNPDLAAQEKIERLTAMDIALAGETGLGDTAFDTAHRLRESLLKTGVDFAHAHDLVVAFKQDAVKTRYENWDELIDYCNHSAAPVGRYLLELHGEDRASFVWSDALCNALQVINHLQDCADDYRELDRVYLPGEWLQAESTSVDALAETRSSPELLRVLHRCAGETETLLVTARQLPGKLKSRSLSMESAIIVAIANKLTRKLAASDPVANRIELNKFEFGACAAGGAISGFFS